MNNSIALDVLRVRQPIGDFFIASIAANDLVAISFADVRRLVKDQRDVEMYLGIQRPLSAKRVNEIKQYVNGPDATFPTAIILAVDERCAEFEEGRSGTAGVLTLKSFAPEDESSELPIPFGQIAKVLDGQHRIAAFIDENHNFSFAGTPGAFQLNIAIFVGADISEQANIFATVNLAQTKVNRSLVYDLTELAEARSPQKTCHNVAVALDGEKPSPFYRRIKRLGTATPGRHYEPLTQAAFVESLLPFISVDPLEDRNRLLKGKRLALALPEELRRCPFRNLFIQNKDVDVAEIVLNYFAAVKAKWPHSWDATRESRNLLPKSNAFKALMRFLREVVYLEVVGDNIGRIPTSREFFPYFHRLTLRDSDFTSKNFVPGSGGQSMFLKMLRQQIGREELIVEGEEG